MKSEIEMVNKAVEYFENQGFLVTTEVPFLHRSIDLVYKYENKLVSIEFKLSDWKRAIEQAKSHLYGSNEVYICIPKPKRGLSPMLKKEIKNSSIGLMFFDEEQEFIEKIFEATQSPKLWGVGENWLNDAFSKRLEVCYG